MGSKKFIERAMCFDERKIYPIKTLQILCLNTEKYYS